MDIYNQLCEIIGHLIILTNLNTPHQTLEYILSTKEYSPELKYALCFNPDWSLKILTRYKKITDHYIKNNIPLEKLIQYVEKNLTDKPFGPSTTISSRFVALPSLTDC